ncbi:MAG: hypothetical protein ACSHWQ_07540 [Spongiibacteraceae bacterium]
MKEYIKKQGQPMMPWEPDMPMTLVSISEADKANGSPKHGDMIAVNPKDSTDMWLVAEQFFQDNYIDYAAPQAAKVPDAIINKVFEKGWIAASHWAGRSDLISDIGSPAYISDRKAALHEQGEK